MSLNIDESQSKKGKIWALGIVELSYDKSDKNLLIWNSNTLGYMQTQSNISVGLSKSKGINSNPENCNLVIIIEDEKSLQNVKNILENLKGKSLCEVSLF